MGKKAVDALLGMFQRLGIATRFGKKIAAFEKGGVVFEDGSTLEGTSRCFSPAATATRW